MNGSVSNAPGWPGSPARWTSSAKSGVGTALNTGSRVWFTISHGVLNEIYYPEVDQAYTRDMGLIVTDGKDFFSEEKRSADSQVCYEAHGVPAYHVWNTCQEGRYRIEKQFIADPQRDVVLQKTVFVPLQGKLTDYRLFVVLAPHLRNRGAGNTAWLADYRGVPMLFAQRHNHSLALACSAPWLKRSAGFVGVSDGWQDLRHHRCMTWCYDRAENGNVALTAEIDLRACNGSFVLALACGLSAAEAGLRARASLLDGFDAAKTQYVREWQDWQKILAGSSEAADKLSIYCTSAMVLRTHESKRFPGCLIASLSIPWGFSKGDDDLGGYHLVWPRDVTESAGGLLAAGARDDVHRLLHYLQVTQDLDGSWPQNMWVDGSPYWRAIQMDEIAFPILLLDLARREKVLDPDDLPRLWPMARATAGFLVHNGPATPQDRWEENSGYSPFTIAVEIASLLVAADLAELNKELALAGYLRETADSWNASIESWCYATGTYLAAKVGVDGYYVRIAPLGDGDNPSSLDTHIPIKNRLPGDDTRSASCVVSTDALALVRFGLRRPDDPRILNTLKVIDAILKVDTPRGPSWHRYNDDGYGEHPDGRAFNGTGVGRAWPLLTGERGHYEVAAGNLARAKELLHAMESFAGEGGMIPEQIWDAPDIPHRELLFGRPTGSAMPLVWAHAEYIKLHRSIRDKRVFDMPDQTVKRYLKGPVSSPFVTWRFSRKTGSMPAGNTLRIEVLASAIVRWSPDDWRSIRETPTWDTGIGFHVADLPCPDVAPGQCVRFTFHWLPSDRWEGTDFEVRIVDERATASPAPSRPTVRKKRRTS